MGQWKEVRLSDTIEIIGGGTPKTNVPEYWDGDIPWLSVVDFNHDRKYVYSTEKYITSKGLNESSTKYLDAGDVIISARGTVGALAVLARPMTFNQSCYGIRPKDKRLSKDFLFYLLRHSVASIKTQVYGAVFDTITKRTFEDIIVNIPPLPEQQAIAEVLSSLDDKIDLLHRNNKTLEEMADIQFQQMFTDCADADLIDEFEITMGQSPPGTSYNEDCVGIEFYQGCTDFGYRFPTSRVYCTDPKRFAKKLDVLLSVRAPVGDINIAFNDCCIGRGLAALRHRNSEVHYSYAYRLLKSIRVAFNLHEETGTIFGAIGKEDLYKIKCPILTTEGVSKYNTKIAALEDKITSNELQIKCLTSVRDLLLPKLMSGALRVKDFTHAHELSVL